MTSDKAKDGLHSFFALLCADLPIFQTSAHSDLIELIRNTTQQIGEWQLAIGD
jgi:hypothetical protein